MDAPASTALAAYPNRRVLGVAGWAAPLLAELAYTTVMTSLRRLAGKGLLASRVEQGRKAHEYRVAMTPAANLAEASAREASGVVERYGDAALAAFAACLADLSPEQRRRLEELAR